MEPAAEAAAPPPPAPQQQPPAAPAAAPAGGVTVLDTYPEVAPLLAAGAGALSRSALAVLQGQVEASTAELRALERAGALVAAGYAEARDGAAELRALHAAHAALDAGLAPHLAVVDELERCVGGLEEAARALDEQTVELEAAFGELL